MTESRSEQMELSAGERDGRDASVGSTKYRDEEWLRQKYHDEGLLAKEIADLCDCAISTVDRWLEKHDIQKKSQAEIQNRSSDTRYTDEDWLRQKYYKDQLSQSEIAELCGVSQGAVSVWMRKYKIEPRNRSQRSSLSMTEERCERHSERMSGEGHPFYGLTGEDHPAYEGGYDGDWRLGNKWQRTRQKVWERDGYTCTRCGASDCEIHAHHINYVCEGGAKYDLENITTLCRQCHIDEHSNRGD